MKKPFFLLALLASSVLGHAQEDQFLFSSEALVQERQGSLKGFHSFVFFPLLKIEEKNAIKTVELIDQELKKVGLVIKKPALTPEGVDLECFSNPSLQFTIEQLVDQNNKPLPVLQARLSVTTVAEISGSKELGSLDTNRWYVYLEKTNDVQKVIKKTLPDLLKQFITDFQKTNTNNEKPTFYISYDDSWWNPPVNP